ncbi:hypothetical protein NLJ89_g710 [Agrocybe chaxingu]|uniref:Uncharacterized protein n=1 Tax=Agrocybe chaxingu TaxID=84603 RepID=A0A9W8TG89_9AGAR|nr:hypothetical protein NLJ89_g710 [Agrocybe chaxingu]
MGLQSRNKNSVEDEEDEDSDDDDDDAPSDSEEEEEKPLVAVCRDLRHTTMTVLSFRIFGALKMIVGALMFISGVPHGYESLGCSDGLPGEKDFPGFPEPLVEMIQGLHQLLLKSLEVKIPQCGPENRNTKAAS